QPQQLSLVKYKVGSSLISLVIKSTPKQAYFILLYKRFKESNIPAFLKYIFTVCIILVFNGVRTYLFFKVDRETSVYTSSKNFSLFLGRDIGFPMSPFSYKISSSEISSK